MRVMSNPNFSEDLVKSIISGIAELSIFCWVEPDQFPPILNDIKTLASTSMRDLIISLNCLCQIVNEMNVGNLSQSIFLDPL